MTGLYIVLPKRESQLPEYLQRDSNVNWAILAHRMDDGSEKPIAFISRTLSPAEKKYTQLEKEGLAKIFAVKKLHQHLSGRKFKYIQTTNHSNIYSVKLVWYQWWLHQGFNIGHYSSFLMNMRLKSTRVQSSKCWCSQ